MDLHVRANLPHILNIVFYIYRSGNAWQADAMDQKRLEAKYNQGEIS